MAKARYRIEQAEVVELSASVKAVITDGMVYLHSGSNVAKLTLREAQVLAGVTGIGEGVPQAIAAAMAEARPVVETVELAGAVEYR